jgi:hypothetical protein
MRTRGCHDNSNIVVELADEMVLMSKFCMPGRVRCKKDNTGEVEVELEHSRLPASDLQPVNWCRTTNRNYIW